MKSLLCLLTVSAMLAAPAAVDAKIVRTVEKTFAVQPGGDFSGLTQGGDIKVTSGDVAEVHVVAKQTFRVDSDKEADALLAEMVFRLEQQGNSVIAESRYEKKATNWFGVGSKVSVSYTVTVPREFNLDLRTSGGDIEVGSIKGTVKARTSGGDLKFAKIDGSVDGHTSGGNIQLEEGTAKANLHTSGGDIFVGRAGGPTSVTTSGGNIKLESVEELISASTSGGDIHATITGPIKQDTELHTSGGQVVVHVKKGTGFQLDASTSGGDVDADGLTLTIEKGGMGKSRLAGAVNGGGPRLKLRSSGGDIKIRAN
ncbi:MAG: DUF4097 family beta strand repeat protein [Candidatus Didemnitutus sp.]|nr:DUF4097 family beta strand repeat protein [Candidatus Didemnitutus sp.]